MNNNFLPGKYREYLGLGAEIALTLIIPLILGYFADSYFESSPFGLLSGGLIGIIFFFFSVFRIARKMNGSKNNE